MTESMIESYTLQTEVSDCYVIQDLFRDTDNGRDHVIRWVTDVREETMRQALIEMGWTPPEDL